MGTSIDFSQYVTPDADPKKVDSASTPTYKSIDFSDVVTPTTDINDSTGNMNFKPRAKGVIDLVRGPLALIDTTAGTLAELMVFNPFIKNERDQMVNSKHVAQQTGKALVGGGKFLGDLATHPIDTAVDTSKSVFEGFVMKPLSDILVTLTGLDPYSPSHFVVTGSGFNKSVSLHGKSVSDEEVEQATTQVAAQALAFYLGAKATSLTEMGLTGLKPIVGGEGLAAIGATRSSAELRAFLEGSGLERQKLFDLQRAGGRLSEMPRTRGFVSGVAGGVAGGFGYAMFGGPEGERLSTGISLALAAAPFGVAFGLVGEAVRMGKGGMFDPVGQAKQLAGKIATTRSIDVIANGGSIAEALFNMDQLQSTKSLEATLARNMLEYDVRVDDNGKLVTTGLNAGVVHNVEAAGIPDILNELKPESGRAPAISVIHARADGFHDILIAPTDMPVPVQDFFRDTGVLQGEQVGFGGNDQYVVTKANKVGREWKLTLRDINTEQHIMDVSPKDLLMKSGRFTGDLAFYQTENLGLSDMLTPERGLTEGPNPLKETAVSDNVKEFIASEVDDRTAFFSGYTVNDFDHPTKMVSIDKSPTTGQVQEVPLVPGQIAEMHSIDGTRHTAIYVDMNGNPVNTATWTSQPSKFGGELNRIHERWRYQNLGPEAKSAATEAMSRYLADHNLMTSGTTSSEGALRAMQKRLNSNQYGRRYSTLGRYSPTTVFHDLMTNLLDFMGFVDDDVHISPEELVSRIGTRQHGGGSLIAGIGETIESINRAREGLYSEPVRTVYQTEAQVSREGGVPPASRETISTPEAAALLAKEEGRGHVPELSTKPSATQRMDVTSDMTLKDVIDSWAADMNLKPEAKAALMFKMEREFGKLARGEPSALLKYNDKSRVPFFKQEVSRYGKAIDAYDKMLQSPHIDEFGRLKRVVTDNLDLTPGALLDEINEGVEQARRSKSIYEARIKSHENPIPREFSPEDQTRFAKYEKEMTENRTKAAKDLVSVAYSNGMYADRSFGGAITLHDMETHRRFDVSFQNEAEARQWIKDTGRVNGKLLDGGSGGNLVPPEAVAGPVMPSPGQGPRANEVPYEFTHDNWFGKMSAFIDRRFPRIVGKRGYMIHMDEAFGTKFFAETFASTQTAKMVSQAKKAPFRDTLKSIQDILDKGGIPRDRWSTVTDYRATKSVADIDKSLIDGRPPNGAEVEMSHHLANSHVDISSVYQYVRDMTELKKNARVASARLDPNDPATAQAIQDIAKGLHEKTNALAKDLNMDGAGLNAAQMFEAAKTQGRDKFRLDVATRRAHALNNNELSRSDYAQKNNMSKAEILAAEALDKYHASLRKEGQVSEDFDHYVEHHYIEGEPIDLGPNADGTAQGTLKLATRLVGGGDITLSQRDPILNAVNYTNRLIDHAHFDTAWESAKNSAEKHLAALPDKARKYAKRVVDEYLYGIKGVPNAHDQYANEMASSYIDDIGGKSLPAKVYKQVVDDFGEIFLSLTSSSMIGGRPMQGMRDMQGFLRNFYTRVGPVRTLSALRLALERDPKTGHLPLRELAESGKIPGLNILQFLSEAEVAELQTGGGNHNIRDAVLKVGDIGMALSGQRNVYALAHGMAYLEGRSFNGKVLLELSRENITKRQAYRRLKLDTYDPPVGQEFDRLVTEGKYDQASEFLSHQTGVETAFVFGYQNSPYGWTSKTGRYLGQFGQWSVFNRDFLARIASRGSVGQRTAAMSRYAMSEAALWSFGRATGFNVSSWYGLPGILFTGGPLVGMANQITDMTGVRGKQRQRAAVNVYGGKVPIVSSFVPGASAFSDYYQAYQLSQKNYGPVPVFGKALGFAVDRTERSWIDEATNQYPRGQKPAKSFIEMISEQAQ